MKDYAENSTQHLIDELTRVYLMLNLAVKKFRYQKKTSFGADKFFGLFISDEEIDELIAEKSLELRWSQQTNSDDPEFKSITKAIKSIQNKIDKRINKAMNQGVIPDLFYFAELFGLSQFEIEILLICLAAEIDLQYGKLFAYLQDDITMKYPSVDLILNLISESFEKKLNDREYFSADSPLFKYKILEFIDEKESLPLLSKQCRVNNRIMAFLFGHNAIDTDLSSIAELYESDLTLNSEILPDYLKEPLEKFTAWHKNNEEVEKQRYIFSFYGNYGTGKIETASAIANELNLPLLVIDLKDIIELNIHFDEMLNLALRESLLLPAILYFKNADILFNNHEQNQFNKKQLIKKLKNYFTISFIDSEEPLELAGELTEEGIIDIEFKIPDFHKRVVLWNNSINEKYNINQECDIEEVAGKFIFSGGQIKDSLKTAFNTALWKNQEEPVIDSDDLIKGCHLQSNQKLKNLAQKLTLKYGIDDIILPKDLKKQLHEIIDCVKYKHHVYGDWGFEQKLSLGKGLNILISGVPGTGKTMSAEIISNELALDLYKIDISTVVSKYIGETEKNLSKIFREAESSNAVLFFDEADALFGKRSDVNDSHDRYANIETGYLLQKMEEYTGIVILATNLKNNMDEAFLRRMQFNMEFPFPDANSRLEIWKNIFPRETPLNSDIDFEFLGHKFNISGGHIKNVALAAAFYAVSASETITMEHIILAIRREFQKLGKLCVRDDFGDYYDLIA